MIFDIADRVLARTERHNRVIPPTQPQGYLLRDRQRWLCQLGLFLRLGANIRSSNIRAIGAPLAFDRELMRGKFHTGNYPINLDPRKRKCDIGSMSRASGVMSDRTLLDRTFWVALILKGLDGVLEIIGGVLLVLVSPAQLGQLARFLTQHEISEDPHDVIANTMLHLTSGLTGSATLFGAIYLLLHGLVKVVLVLAILKNKLWAYPWMVAFLIAFILYQGYQLIAGFSWGLVLLTAFDIFIVVLTIREYGNHRRRLPGKDRNAAPATTEPRK